MPPDKPNPMAELVNEFVSNLGKSDPSEIIRARRVAEVAEIIDRLRHNPDVGTISSGTYIANKLADEGYLAVEEEYGLEDYLGEISPHPQAEARKVAGAFVDYTLLRRYTTEWRELYE